ncbi:MAG: 1-acyl-sn-glycerol-3-phosphate acyltransferase [Spirochaetales bacterium]|jgi:1-acyl-sn-glycerol-3-phosphate acyltransferase|nr:1-acyl-sn-glycerol-3-phosphate acyltransferase [Spirochaetales bacterium]
MKNPGDRTPAGRLSKGVKNNKINSMVRSLLFGFFFWLYTMFISLAIIPIGLCLLFRRPQAADRIFSKLVGAWGRTVFIMAGIKVEVRGKEKLPPHDRICFVSNHQSYGDIPLILGYLGKKTGFIAKRELSRVPILSFWMKQLQCIFINRGHGNQSIRLIAEGMKKISQGRPLVIFPEGHRSKDGVMRHFKSGGIHLAANEDITIVPLTIDGMFHAYEEKKRITPGTAIITVHDPIETTGLSPENRRALTKQIQNIICEALPEQYRIKAEKPAEQIRGEE